MSDKSIIVTISKKGKVKVEAMNFHGVGCAAVVEAFSSALGTVTAEGNKHELYEEDQCATITQYQ